MKLNNKISFSTKIDEKVEDICQTVKAWNILGRHTEILLLEDIVKRMERPKMAKALRILVQHEKP